jgi:hypothetical protein
MIILPNRKHSTLSDDKRNPWVNVFTPLDAKWGLSHRAMSSLDNLTEIQEENAKNGYRQLIVAKSILGWQLRGNDAVSKDVIVLHEDLTEFMWSVRREWVKNYSNCEIIVSRKYKVGQEILGWLYNNKTEYHDYEIVEFT